MALENLIPSAPNGNLVKWVIAIAAFAIIIFVADQYFGGGNLFGFKKPKVKTYPPVMAGIPTKPLQKA
ncbi:hypothetical protein JZU46_01105 [bacterium]|jgi:hypothetical protein|nr:hypothetical protein [bacterium]